jgi:hypothetical protein
MRRADRRSDTSPSTVVLPLPIEPEITRTLTCTAGRREAYTEMRAFHFDAIPAYPLAQTTLAQTTLAGPSGVRLRQYRWESR